eukprot:5487560-Pyramimonas_sp.AAC.1
MGNLGPAHEVVVDGTYRRGKRWCCPSRSAWAELWCQVWETIDGWGGIDQAVVPKANGHCSQRRVQAG